MSSKVHSQGNIPFSWEYKPGESKAARAQNHLADVDRHLEEPPPPCPPFQDKTIPLPPCAFPQSSRSSSKKGLRKSDDPFLIAYKEVTKASAQKGGFWNADRSSAVGSESGLKNVVFFFTCKQPSSVLTEDSIFRLPQIPNSRSLRRDADY